MAEVREEGPYWVKAYTWEKSKYDSDWSIAYWYKDSRVWRFADPIDAQTTVDLIGPRILPPKEEIKVREDGHYWVKSKYDNEWSIAEWLSPDWYYKNSEESFKDEHFNKIGPRIIPPEGE